MWDKAHVLIMFVLYGFWDVRGFKSSRLDPGVEEFGYTARGFDCLDWCLLLLMQACVRCSEGSRRKFRDSEG